MNLKTGKLAPRHDDRTLRLANYLTLAQLPDAPPSFSHASKVSPWGMFGNDRLGDCTYAAAAHMIKLAGKLEGEDVSPAEAEVESDYLRMSPNDQGCVMLDVLNFWRNTGIGGHKLSAFAALNLRNPNHIKLAVVLFGGVYLGVALPVSAQAQTGPGKVWDVGSAANGWGGHAINVVGYDTNGLEVITWGEVQRMTWAFWDAYADEAWVTLTRDWEQTPAASGIDFAALQADLKQLSTE